MTCLGTKPKPLDSQTSHHPTTPFASQVLYPHRPKAPAPFSWEGARSWEGIRPHPHPWNCLPPLSCPLRTPAKGDLFSFHILLQRKESDSSY